MASPPAAGDSASSAADTDPQPEPAGIDSVAKLVKRSILLFWAGGLVVYYGMGALRSLRPLITILVISLFLSFAIEPAVNRMARRGIRRGLGTMIVFLVILLALAGFSTAIGTALATQINDFVDEVPDYLDDIETWVNDTFNADIEFDELREQFLNEGNVQSLATRVAGNVANASATVFGLIFQVFTVALFTFYLVAEGPKVRLVACSFLNDRRRDMVLDIWDLAMDKTGGYIYSRTVLAAISALAHWVVFLLLDVPFPLPLALWVGVISQFIPVIGTYIAGALPVLVALLGQPLTALWVLVTIFVYQQIENYLLSPRITAHTMEIHVAVAFGSVIAGSALMGIVGALLALPFAATVQGFISTLRAGDAEPGALDQGPSTEEA